MGMSKEQELETSKIIEDALNGKCKSINTEIDMSCPPVKPKSIFKLPYSIEVTRLHNKQFAPKGGVYLVIRYIDMKNRMKYQNALLVKSDVAYTEETKLKVANALWVKLKAKFAL